MFSFKVSVIVEMNEYNKITIKYLFFKFILADSSKPKAEKPKKEKKPKDEKEETSPEPEKEKSQRGNSLFKQLYIDNGYDGIVKMLSNVKASLGTFFGKLYKTVTVRELYLTMRVTGSDAADTAIKYGKLSSWLFPLLGKVASTCKMKKYNVDVSPDFIGVKNEAELYLNVSIVPIRITNAAIVLLLQLAFKIVFKVLFANNNAKKSGNILNDTLNNANKTASTETVETVSDAKI